jgi:hypothetical protein
LAFRLILTLGSGVFGFLFFAFALGAFGGRAGLFAEVGFELLPARGTNGPKMILTIAKRLLDRL